GKTWTNFQNISDATGTVDFNVSGSVTGNVTALTADYTAYTQDLTLDITNNTITNGGVGGTFVVTNVNGNATQNRTVTCTAETYSLTDGTPNAGTGNGYTWSAFRNISDATGTVGFNVSGSVTGNVTAQTLDYTTYGQALTFDISAGTITNDGVGGTLAGFTTVNANAAQSNTVAGTGENYSLTDGTANAGSGNGYTWSAFRNVNDATGTVDFNASGSVTGSVTAQTLDYSGYGSAVTVAISGANAGTATGIGTTFSGVSTISGNAAQSNTMGGTGQTYSLTDGTPNAGSSNSISWTAFRNINDATGTVDFNVSGSVTGNVTAQTLDYTTYGQALTFDISNNTITNGGVGGTLVVTNVNGNAAQTNTVTGTGENYSLTDGTANAGSGGGYNWTAFRNINDATGTVDFNA